MSRLGHNVALKTSLKVIVFIRTVEFQLALSGCSPAPNGPDESRTIHPAWTKTCLATSASRAIPPDCSFFTG